MDDIPSWLLTDYSLPTILAASALGLVVWVLAHANAEPGTTVRVLWGLAEYTKSGARVQGVSSTQAIDQSHRARANTGKSKGNQPKPPISTHYLKSDAEAELKVSELRSLYGLRQLQPIENEIRISNTPSGTFFFSWIEIDFTGRFSAFLSAYRSPVGKLFELHKRKTGDIYAVLFVSEADARRLEVLGDCHQVVVTALAAPWQANTCLAEVPVERVHSATLRTVEDDGRTIGCVDISLN